MATIGAGEVAEPGRAHLPDATYFIAASRLRPGLDGGFAIATLQRALHFERVAGVVPTLLTFDPAQIDGVVETFRELGLASDATRMRNLFAELRERPELVREAALHPMGVPDAPTVWTDVVARDGSVVVRLPYVPHAEWFRTVDPIPVLAADGSVLGALRGFGELYRLWVDAVVAEAGEREVVVIVEAKQVGELLARGPRAYALVHTLHNAHTLSPHQWDSEVDALWAGWFDVVDEFDGVMWLTQAQRADAVQRFGEHEGWAVVPHPAQPARSSTRERDPYRAVMIARLVEQKRVDDAVRAWPAVLAREPRARLDVYGDGPLRAELEELIAELSLEHAVTLRGHDHRAADELSSAALLVVSSRHEGWPLAITEARERGCPVVSYDVPYGPAQMIESGVDGELVAPGDVAGLASAIGLLLGHPERIAAYSEAALAWANANGVVRAMEATGEVIAAAIARSRRRRLLS